MRYESSLGDEKAVLASELLIVHGEESIIGGKLRAHGRTEPPQVESGVIGFCESLAQDDSVGVGLHRDEVGIIKEVQVCSQENAVLDDLGLAASVWVDMCRLEDGGHVCPGYGTGSIVCVEKHASEALLLFAPDLLGSDYAALVCAVILNEDPSLLGREIVKALQGKGVGTLGLRNDWSVQGEHIHQVVVSLDVGEASNEIASSGLSRHHSNGDAIFEAVHESRVVSLSLIFPLMGGVVENPGSVR